MPPKDDPETAALRAELKQVYNKIREDQKSKADQTLESACGSLADAPKVRMSTKKFLKGHINKVNQVHFSGDNRFVF